MRILEQMGRTAHDQLALIALAAGPAGKSGGNQLLRELVELGAGGGERPLELGPGLGQGATAHMGIDEVRGLGQRSDRQPGRNRDDPVLDLAVLGDQDHQRALGLEPHEVDVLEANIGLGGEHHAGRPGETGQHSGGLVEHRLHRAAGGGDFRFHVAAIIFAEIADFHQAHRQRSASRARSATARMKCAGRK